MKLIDNINNLFGNDIKSQLNNGSENRIKIAASYFSIYAFAALSLLASFTNQQTQ